MTKSAATHLPFLLLVLVYLGLSVLYQAAVPLFEAPDEPSHPQYIAFLSIEKRLPLYGVSPDVPGQGMQPPLYYLMSVPLFRLLVDNPVDLIRDLRHVNRQLYQNVRRPPRTGQGIVRHRYLGRQARQFQPNPSFSYLRHLRWPALGFGLLAVFLTYVAALRAFANPPLAVLCAGLLALNPQFLFTSAYVNNDTTAAAVGALMLCLTVLALGDPARGRRRHYLLAALLIAVAIVAKNSTLPGLAVGSLAIFLADGRPFKRRIGDALRAIALFALLITPYLAWNLEYRGSLLGMSAVWESATKMLTYEGYGGAWSYFTGMYWVWTFESYWGRFGWINVLAPTAVYVSYLTLTGAGGLGFVLAGRSAKSSHGPTNGHQDTSSRSLRVYLGGAALITLAAHIWFNLNTAQPQGRHLFPVAPQIACILGLGLAYLFAREPGPIQRRRIFALLVVLTCLAIYCCIGVIVPAYA